MRQHDGAAHQLVRVTRVDAQVRRDHDGLVELRARGLLDEFDGFGQVTDLPGLRRQLGRRTVLLPVLHDPSRGAFVTASSVTPSVLFENVHRPAVTATRLVQLPSSSTASSSASVA